MNELNELRKVLIATVLLISLFPTCLVLAVMFPDTSPPSKIDVIIALDVLIFCLYLAISAIRRGR